MSSKAALKNEPPATSTDRDTGAPVNTNNKKLNSKEDLSESLTEPDAANSVETSSQAGESRSNNGSALIVFIVWLATLTVVHCPV